MASCVVCGRDVTPVGYVSADAGWVCEEHVPAGRRERLAAMRELALEHDLAMICVAPALPVLIDDEETAP